MEIAEKITINRAKHTKVNEVDFANLEFGAHVSDHMFICKYARGEWQKAEIVPFADLSLSPATLALHYGQSVFEGMKAFRMNDGSINIFRIDKHYSRLKGSLSRMCMPEIGKEFFCDALHHLVTTDQKWMPSGYCTSLYLRPLVFASEARLGVKIADEYQFIIFSSPVGRYYQKPIKVKVERQYIRAAKGGTGYAKCAGNYGGAFYPTQLAREQGYDQVIWTDAKHNEYIEESGMMNIMFVIDGKLITPALSDSILDGITRSSFLELANDLHIPSEEGSISVSELKDAFYNKTISEAFGVGTAAVVAPVEVISIDDTDYHLPVYSDRSVMNRLKSALEDIRYGNTKDSHEWNYVISPDGL